jgi:hypothetical protein
MVFSTYRDGSKGESSTPWGNFRKKRIIKNAIKVKLKDKEGISCTFGIKLKERNDFKKGFKCLFFLICIFFR